MTSTDSQSTRQLHLEPIVDSSPLLSSPEALRRRFQDEGYLYLRGLLDVSRVRALQEDIFACCREKGWFDPGTTSIENGPPVVVPVNEGEAPFFRVYDEVQKLESLHTQAHDSDITRVMRMLLDETAFPHPLSICRLIFPDNNEAITPPHQDYPNNQGTTELYACWMPLVDCPVERGGLAMLPGSHRYGLLPLEFSLGPGNRQAVVPAELAQQSWVGGDYRPGDVLIFHSLMLHRSLPNLTDRMRLSVDFRYQSVHEPMTESCLNPHFGRLSWDQIYAGWASREYQYYWRKLPLKFAPWTTRYHDLPDDHIKEATRQFWRYNAHRRNLSEAGKVVPEGLDLESGGNRK